MLVPIYLGLCRTVDLDKGHAAAGALINANLGMAVMVSVVHSVAMIAAGGLLAWLVYRYLGPQVRVAELVQPGCDVGREPPFWWALVAAHQASQPNTK